MDPKGPLTSLKHPSEGEAYDVSFAKLASLVAYRGSRRFESQRILRDEFHWLAPLFFLNSVAAPLGVCLESLGTVLIVPERVLSACGIVTAFRHYSAPRISLF